MFRCQYNDLHRETNGSKGPKGPGPKGQVLSHAPEPHPDCYPAILCVRPRWHATLISVRPYWHSDNISRRPCWHASLVPTYSPQHLHGMLQLHLQKIPQTKRCTGPIDLLHSDLSKLLVTQVCRILSPINCKTFLHQPNILYYATVAAVPYHSSSMHHIGHAV